MTLRLLASSLVVVLTACGGAAPTPQGTSGGETNTADPQAPAGESGGSSDPGQAAPDVGGEDGGAPTCANVRCAAGTHCELRQVMCVRAPCPPLPECVAD